MPRVIEYRVGESADLFSFKLAQIKALGGLNLIVILVDIPEGLRDHDLHHLDWLTGDLPSKALQKLDAGRIVRCVGVVCLGNKRQGIRRRGFFFLDDSNEQNVAAKSSAIRKIRFNRTFGLIEQMNMDGVLPSKSILWFLQKLVGIR